MRNLLSSRSGFGCRASAMAVLLAVSGAAFAQSDANTKQPDDAVLKGPQVKERDVPGVVNSFGQGQGARRMAERIPPEVLREALGVLTSSDAPDAIRATEEQAAEFKAVSEELRAAVRQYTADHREELIELRKDANLNGRAAQEVDRAIGRRPGGAGRQGAAGGDEADEKRTRSGEKGDSAETPMMDEAAAAKQEAARQRLREIMAGAPKIEDYMTRAWEKLSPAQREAVDAKLDEYRAREAKKREEAYVKQRVNDRKPDAAPKRPAASDDEMAMKSDKAAPRQTDRPARPDAANAQRRERLVRLFERLSPEQQEVLLERLESAARDGGFGQGAPGRARGQRAPRNGDKPAPAMDDVDVPRPEEVEKDAPRKSGQEPDPV